MVKGSAIIMPNMPINEPHIERDNKMMAGLRPVIFPMIFGTINASCMIWTTIKTAVAEAMMIQKLSPVSAAFKIANKIVGTKPII